MVGPSSVEFLKESKTGSKNGVLLLPDDVQAHDSPE